MNETEHKIDLDYLIDKMADLQVQVGGRELLPIFIEQTRKVLGKSPAAYLRYGPYWWAMKRILRAGGVSVGVYDEPVWADDFAMMNGDGTVNAELTLLAGWEFADLQNGTYGVLTSEYPIGDRTFVLHDPDQAASA